MENLNNLKVDGEWFLPSGAKVVFIDVNILDCPKEDEKNRYDVGMFLRMQYGTLLRMLLPMLSYDRALLVTSIIVEGLAEKDLKWKVKVSARYADHIPS